LDRSAPPTGATVSHWREDKVGLLATMTSAVQAHDPCPTIPDVFVDPARMQALAQALKGATGVTAADLAPAAGAAPDAAAPAGRIEPVLGGLRARQAEVGEPGPEEPATSPRSQVAKAVTYLTNQAGRMQYAKYRQQGLPITSSHIESTIKQMNRRVKGTEKFW